MNNYFCVLPFFGAEYSRHSSNYTPCCLLPSNTDTNQLQLEMLSRQRSSACKKCWDLEDQGKISDRQIKNSSFDFYKNQDLRYIEDDCRNGNYSPQIIKVYTSNVCNGTCVTCNADSSSAWANLEKVKTFKILNDEIIHSIDFKNIVMLAFVGGEPFYEKKNFEILEKLIKVNNTNCFISFTSNGSVKFTDQQKDILKHFANLNITLSIDGINKRFEYMRYPLKWSTLLENIEFFRENNVPLSVSYTISNLNILYYNETTEWFKSQNLNYNHILVSNPSYFSPESLPKEIKHNLVNSNFLLNEYSSIDHQNFIKACEEIKRQDLLKKINIKDYLPEFYEIIPPDLR